MNPLRKLITYQVLGYERRPNEIEVGLTFAVDLDFIGEQNLWVATPFDTYEGKEYAIPGVGRTTHEAILDVIANRLFKHQEDEEEE